MADFPRDIIIDILLKLPVKSLGKFRCVSKYWCSVISDPQFIANHLRISSSDDNYTNHQIILTCKGRDLRFKSCSVLSLFNKPSTDAVDIVHSSFSKPVKSVKVVGSCNGLLCIVTENEKVYLWNPTIRESKALPDSGLRVETSFSCISYGFGFDSSIDDYKVVAVLSVRGPELSNDTKVMAYTLRPNCWRRIADFPIGPDRDPGLLVGGALIWGARRFDGRGFKVDDKGQHFPCINTSWHILAFELATEKQTMLPEPANEKFGMDLILGKLGECLCLCSNYREMHVDIWVMKDYGVEESWCKMFTLPYYANQFHVGCYPFYRPLLYSKKNGELLFGFGSDLVFYNPENETLRKPRINKFRPCLKSITYVESLVSPNVDGRFQTPHQ